MAAPSSYAVAYRDEATRADFIVKVYQHLILALVSFVAVESLLLQLGVAKAAYEFLAGSSGAWLLVMGGFMLVSWLATTAAHDLGDTNKQYAGLFALVAAEAVIFAPFLYYLFEVRSEGSTVWAAAVITGIGFAGLSGVAYTTRKDLSFLRPMIMWGGICAIVLILAAFLFGLDLGVWFSVAMIALAGGSILYQTQTVLHSYPPEAYVGGAVQLFASVMLLFWYVLRLLSQLRR